MAKEKEKDPLLCRILGHDWVRVKELDRSPADQACRCKRCRKVIHLG